MEKEPFFNKVELRFYLRVLVVFILVMLVIYQTLDWMGMFKVYRPY